MISSIAMNNRYDLFISYSRKDFSEVNALVVRLQRCIPGLRCWFDLTGIEGGDEFGEKIVSAIDSSDHVLFMVSDASMTSVWTKKEVTYAKNIGKRVVPILLKGAQIKGWFLFEYGLIDSIDSSDPKHVDKLVYNISTWTGKERTKSADAENRGDVTVEQDVMTGQSIQFDDRRLILDDNEMAELAYDIGEQYENGEGVEQDYERAIYCYREAAEHGNDNAIRRLAELEKQ